MTQDKVLKLDILASEKLSPSVHSHVTLDKLLKLSEPQFPLL